MRSLSHAVAALACAAAATTCPSSPAALDAAAPQTTVDCGFEVDFCGWDGDGGDAAWRRGAGATPTQNTGPAGDATPGLEGEGAYAYVEASYPNHPDVTFSLTSPVLAAAAGDAVVSFAYSMFRAARRRSRCRLLEEDAAGRPTPQE